MIGRFVRSALLLSLILSLGPAWTGQALAQALLEDLRGWHALPGDACPPLPPPAGVVVDVSTVAELQSAVNNAAPHTTIRLADGIYSLDGVYLWLGVAHVTLRSASGDREAVILDGNYVTTEIVQVAASDVIIADLTLREARDHPIHVMSTSGSGTDRTLIYNVHVIDPGQQAIKINPVPGGHYTDEGEIACSRIELTDAGRPRIWEFNDSCYTGGVDAHQSRGWVVRDNEIEGFWCDEGLSEHAIHFWVTSRDTVVERNRLVDNARGVGLGLVTWREGRTYPDQPCPAAGGDYVDHYGGMVRNNFVHAGRDALFASGDGFDCGICLWNACGAQVLHNTVVSTQAPASSSLEWRFPYTDVDLANNLASHVLLDRGGTAHLAGNLEHQPLSLFMDGPGGDLHLRATATAAIDRGAPLPPGLCDADIDGDPRPIGAARDVGADETGVPPPAAVSDLRVTEAVTSTAILTATLRWTAPGGADSAALRYAEARITGSTWPAAGIVSDTLPGGTEVYTAVVPYAGETVYFALKSYNAEGGWSALSNNAFWPAEWMWLPLVTRRCPSLSK